MIFLLGNQNLQIYLGLWKTLWQRCSLWSQDQLSEDLDYFPGTFYNSETKYFKDVHRYGWHFLHNSFCTINASKVSFNLTQKMSFTKHTFETRLGINGMMTCAPIYLFMIYLCFPSILKISTHPTILPYFVINFLSNS